MRFERRRACDARVPVRLPGSEGRRPVVHVDHGIGVFVGPSDRGRPRDAGIHGALRGEDKLSFLGAAGFVEAPARETRARSPGRNDLGEAKRVRRRCVIRPKSSQAYARKAVPGHAFSPDSHRQQEFEDAFE